MTDNVHVPITASRRKAATVFYVLNVLLSPITLIGYVLWVARIYTASHGSDVSSNARRD